MTLWLLQVRPKKDLQPSHVKAPKWKPAAGSSHTLHNWFCIGSNLSICKKKEIGWNVIVSKDSFCVGVEVLKKRGNILVLRRVKYLCDKRGIIGTSIMVAKLFHYSKSPKMMEIDHFLIYDISLRTIGVKSLKSFPQCNGPFYKD